MFPDSLTHINIKHKHHVMNLFDDGENELYVWVAREREREGNVSEKDLHSFLMKIVGHDNGPKAELGGLH